jgi:hypothetical protein
LCFIDSEWGFFDWPFESAGVLSAHPRNLRTVLASGVPVVDDVPQRVADGLTATVLTLRTDRRRDLTDGSDGEENVLAETRDGVGGDGSRN